MSLGSTPRILMAGYPELVAPLGRRSFSTTMNAIMLTYATTSDAVGVG